MIDEKEFWEGKAHKSEILLFQQIESYIAVSTNQWRFAEWDFSFWN